MKLQKEMECIDSNCQLLCISDASTKAFAFVIYLSSDASVNLFFSKVRVAPIKKN